MKRVFRVVLNDSGSRYMAEMMNKLEQQYGAEEIGTAEYTEEAVNDGLRKWLSSFDTNSATECFTAVNLLKQRLEGEKCS